MKPDHKEWTHLPYLYCDVFRFIPYDTKSVLEVGIGWGIVSGLLKTYMGIEILDAIEIHKPYIDRLEPLNLYRKVYHGDARDILPRLEGIYDVVLCTETIEHLPAKDIPAVLSHFERLGSRVVLSSPNRFFPSVPWDDNDFQKHQSRFDIRQARALGFTCLGADVPIHRGRKLVKRAFGSWFSSWIGYKDREKK